MQPFNYVLAFVFALIIGGGTLVAYRKSKQPSGVNPKNYYPYTPNKMPAQTFTGVATKSPGCGCNANKH